MGTPGFVTLTLEIHRINIGKWKLDAFERYISIYKYYLREPFVTSMIVRGRVVGVFKNPFDKYALTQTKDHEIKVQTWAS